VFYPINSSKTKKKQDLEATKSCFLYFDARKQAIF